MILHHRITNLVVKCDPAPLANVGDIVRLLTSPNPPSLWMVERNLQGQPVRLRGAQMGELGPVPEHRCPVKAQEAVSRPRSAGVVPGHPKALPGPPAARQTPPSGQRTASHSARPAATRRSEPCSRCRKPVLLDGPEHYIAMELGATVLWAIHDECQGG